MTIKMEATEPYFPVVLLIMLYKLFITFNYLKHACVNAINSGCVLLMYDIGHF